MYQADLMGDCHRMPLRLANEDVMSALLLCHCYCSCLVRLWAGSQRLVAAANEKGNCVRIKAMIFC